MHNYHSMHGQLGMPALDQQASNALEVRCLLAALLQGSSAAYIVTGCVAGRIESHDALGCMLQQAWCQPLESDS